MIPVWVQPWMLKAAACVALLSTAFGFGCQVQRGIDRGKIQRLKTDYKRCVGIVDTCVDNVDTLELAIEEYNAKVIKLGEEYNAKVKSIKAAHEKNITKLNKRNTTALRKAEDEAADLRKRMAKLSVAEACHAAWEEVAK